MVNRKLIKIAAAGVTLIGLFAIIIFKFFNQNSSEKIFASILEKPIRKICSNCSVDVSNFDITSYNPSKFQITTDLKVYVNQTNVDVLHASQIKLEFNLSKIFSKFLIPMNIDAHSAKLNLDIIFNKKNNNNGLIKLLGVFNDRSLLVPNNIKIEKSNLLINNISYSFDLKKTTKNNSYATNTIILTSNNLRSKIEILTNQENKTKSTKYKIYNFPATFITSNISSKFQNDLLDNINKNLFISGTIDTKDDSKNRILKAKFYNQPQDQQNKASTIKFLLSLNSKDWHNRIDIEHLNLSLPRESELIYAKGYLKNDSNLLKQKTSLLLSFKTKKFDITTIHNSWPKKLLLDTREWLTTSIKTGKFTNLQGRIYIKNIYSNNSDNISISGTSKFHNLNLRYLPEFPQIDKLTGLMTFNNSELNFDIHHGKMIDSSIKKGGSVKINLKNLEIPLIIDVKANGPLKDFTNFIAKENLLKLKRKKIDLQNIYGSVNSTVNIKLPLAKQICLDNLSLKADADLTNVKFIFLDKFTLRGSLILTIRNYLLSINGTPLINNIKSKFNWQTYLKDNMEFNHKLDINTILDTSSKDFSLFYDMINISKGKIFLNAQYIQKQQTEQITINSNLDNPKVYIHGIDLLKHPNKKSNFNLILINVKGQGWKTKQCILSSDEENIKSSSYFELSDNLEEIKKFNSTIESPNNKVKLDCAFNKKEGKFFINADYIIPDKNHLFQLLNSQNFSKDKTMSVQIKINKAFMKNNVIFKDISGIFKCYKNTCKNSTLSMKINDRKKPNSNLKIFKNNKTIVLRTNNAAALLKSLDTYSNIEGGHMTITFRPKGKHYLQKKRLEGDIYIKNFKALKTSILAKLILMTPFTQIVDQLRGEDLIHFKNFKGSFSIANGTIKLRQSMATGDLIAVTLKGSINLEKQTVNLEGELIPKCFFNEFMSRIQNKKNHNSEKFQLATHYKISGSLNNPKIHVTPISILVSLFTKPLSII